MTSSVGGGFVGLGEDEGFRLTGKIVSVPYYAIAKYNYSVYCFRVPFADNEVLSEFKGKLLPIKTVVTDASSGDTVYNGIQGYCFNLLDWIVAIGILLIAVETKANRCDDSYTCTLCSACGCYENYIYYSGANSLSCTNGYSYCEDDSSVASCNSKNDTNRMAQILYSIGLIAAMAFFGLYSYFLFIVIRNKLFEHNLLLFTKSMLVYGLYGLTASGNTFIEMTKTKYLELGGFNVNSEGASFINLKFQSESKIHVHLYKEEWWKKFQFWPCVFMLLSWIYYGYFIAGFISYLTITPIKSCSSQEYFIC